MLRIGEEYAVFEGCSSQSDIFFDNLNERICSVRGNGEMGITARGLKDNDVVSFRIPAQGRIRSLNFSSDSQVASIRRDDTSVDFVFLDDPNNIAVVRQTCRRSDATMLGVQWVADKQLIMISTQGFDLFTINTKRRQIKFTKGVNVTTNWFVSYTPSQLIFTSSGITNSILNPFVIQANSIHTLAKFEVNFGCSTIRPKLLAKDVTVASIYERLMVLVLKSGMKDAFIEHVNIYEFSQTNPFAPPQLTNVLLLNLSGLIAVHVVDNSIIVHHKNSNSSLVYEIGNSFDADDAMETTTMEESRKQPTEILPLCITNVELADALKNTLPTLGGQENEEISLYNSSSAVFLPNLMADIRLGIFTTLKLVVHRASIFIKNNNLLIDFLIKRTNAERIFLEVFKRCIMHRLISVSKICKIFRRILQADVDNNISSNSIDRDSKAKCQLICEPVAPHNTDHNVILRNVFDPLRDCDEMDKKFLSYLVLEFFLIVKRMKIPLKENYLPEFLLRVLVDAKQFNKLQQLLQYGVIDDSKFLAYELITLSAQYEPLGQMAIDMLARRDNVEQVADVLMSQGCVIEAARSLVVDNHYRVQNFISVAVRILCPPLSRFHKSGHKISTRLDPIQRNELIGVNLNLAQNIQSYTREIRTAATLDRIHCLRLLECAWKTKNRHIMFTIYFHLRYIQKSRFLDGTHDGFENYTRDFQILYKDEEIEEAERRFRLAHISTPNRKGNENSILIEEQNRSNDAWSNGSDSSPTSVQSSLTDTLNNTTADENLQELVRKKYAFQKKRKIK